MKQTPDFDIPTTADYAVSVGGQPAAVYVMPTRYGQTLENNKPVSVYDGAPLRQPMYFACADIGGPTTVTVEVGFLPADDIRSVTAHPLSRGIEVRREGARVTFEVDRPGTVTLLVNGDHRDRPLHLFFSPPVEDARIDLAVLGGKARAAELFRPWPDDGAGPAAIDSATLILPPFTHGFICRVAAAEA